MVKSYAPIQTYEAKQLSYDLLNNPKDFYKHNRRYATSFVLNVTYGKRAPICIPSLLLSDFRGMQRDCRHLRLPNSVRQSPTPRILHRRYLSITREESDL